MSRPITQVSVAAHTTDYMRLRQVAFGLARGVLGASADGVGVWAWDCNLACPGCSSTHTWEAGSEADAHWVSIDVLLQLAASRNAQRLVISGGEPTLQAPAATALASGFKAMFPDHREVVLYSGLRWPVLKAQFPELVASVDVVVAGPYVQGLPANALAGSSNQEVILLTPLAQELYAGWESWPVHQLQVASQTTANGDTELITVGIPDNDRLTRATEQLAQPVQQVSWRSAVKNR